MLRLLFLLLRKLLHQLDNSYIIPFLTFLSAEKFKEHTVYNLNFATEKSWKFIFCLMSWNESLNELPRLKIAAGGGKGGKSNFKQSCLVNVGGAVMTMSWLF